MMCREYREDVVEWARGSEPARALVVHIAECAECAGFLEEQRALSAVLQRLAAEEIPAASETVARVMAEFDRAARTARHRVLGWFAAGAVAAAACLALLVTPHRPAPPEASQFISIPYTIPLAPEERATVVRMDIPVSALIAAGFQMSATDPGATMQADVLVSQDGRARAIRPISILSSN
jgi:hypothetical protein